MATMEHVVAAPRVHMTAGEPSPMEVAVRKIMEQVNPAVVITQGLVGLGEGTNADAPGPCGVVSNKTYVAALIQAARRQMATCPEKVDIIFRKGEAPVRL